MRSHLLNLSISRFFGAAIASLVLGSFNMQVTAEEQQVPASDELSAAFAELVGALQHVEKSIRQSPSFGSEAEQVAGYRHVLRSFAKGLEAEVYQHVDYPYFRILDFWLKEGGDNPDQRYAFAPIKGGETYRVWGTLGSAARMELQIYSGRPWDGTGKSTGYLNFENIKLKEDGGFEIFISAEEQGENWLKNPDDATTLFSRHIYDEWTDEQTGTVHIDRVGYEGRRKPPESPQELADRMRAAAVMFSTTATTWPASVNNRFFKGRPVNSLVPPYDTYRLGGAKGRWMSGAAFSLEPDQALVVRMPESSAHYQALQLTDMWMASLEHGNQVSSLTRKQSILADDGAYYYVISQTDPGYHNWIDSGEHSRGTVLLRWDGVQGKLEAGQYPSSFVVSVDEVANRIPGFERVEPSSRDAVRAQRRQHLQLRSQR